MGEFEKTKVEQKVEKLGKAGIKDDFYARCKMKCLHRKKG